MNSRNFEMIQAIEQIAGVSLFSGGIFMIGWNELAEWIPNVKEINPWLGMIATILGMGFVLSKWRGQRLKNEQTELENEQLKRNLEDSQTKKE